MRQLRLTSTKDIISKATELKGKKANIVYSDGRVFFGKILSIDDQQLALKNMRLKDSRHLLIEISEIILDA